MRLFAKMTAKLLSFIRYVPNAAKFFSILKVLVTVVMEADLLA